MVSRYFVSFAGCSVQHTLSCALARALRRRFRYPGQVRFLCCRSRRFYMPLSDARCVWASHKHTPTRWGLFHHRVSYVSGICEVSVRQTSFKPPSRLLLYLASDFFCQHQTRRHVVCRSAALSAKITLPNRPLFCLPMRPTQYVLLTLTLASALTSPCLVAGAPVRMPGGCERRLYEGTITIAITTTAAKTRHGGGQRRRCSRV